MAPKLQFNYCVVITFQGDQDPFSASFDDFAVLKDIVGAAVRERQASVRSILIESNIGAHSGSTQ